MPQWQRRVRETRLRVRDTWEYGVSLWLWKKIFGQGERYTFERSGYIQLLYGSSAKACWIVSIAPSISASVMRLTWIGMLVYCGALVRIAMRSWVAFQGGMRGQRNLGANPRPRDRGEAMIAVRSSMSFVRLVGISRSSLEMALSGEQAQDGLDEIGRYSRESWLVLDQWHLSKGAY